MTTGLEELIDLAHRSRAAGDLPAAEAAYRQALALMPQSDELKAFLGATLLMQGKLKEGFPLYDARRRYRPGYAPNLPFPRWSGQDVAGKRLMIWSEEGFGDQIMMARFAGVLRDRGANVSWLCPPSLVRLFDQGLGVTAIPAEGTFDLPPFDFYCPSSALPLGFDLSLEAIPPAPYLRSPPPNAPEGRGIGVMARGNPKQANDPNRSMPPDAAAQLLAFPGAISLAPEDTGAKDFYETASIIAGLDLVITVDTSVAHLAGALGKTTWVMLAAVGTDWRWIPGRDDSPWYAAMRLFWQERPRDWNSVLAAVHRELGA